MEGGYRTLFVQGIPFWVYRRVKRRDTRKEKVEEEIP